MDPVSTALLAALTAGVAGGAAQVGKDLVVDAYQALKAALQRKYGPDSDLVEAVDKLEKEPESPGWREKLAAQVKETGADRDPAVLKAAEELLAQLKSSSGPGVSNGAQIKDADTAGVADLRGADLSRSKRMTIGGVIIGNKPDPDDE